MRREKAGWVTWRSCAEREKLRVSAKLTKSSSHLVSMRGRVGAARVVLSVAVLGRLLQPPHLGIPAVPGQQLGMRSALDDAARLHHEDLVCIDNGRQPVRD